MTIANTGQAQNVALVLGGADVAAGNPFPVTSVIGAGTAKIGKVTDQPLNLVASGQKTTGASATVAGGQSGAGYITILNTDASAGAYLGVGTVDATMFLLSAGSSVTWPVADITTIKCFGTGAVLSWAWLQVA